MAEKGFKNGCLELIQGMGHTPDAGHICMYINGTELRFQTSEPGDYILINSSFHRCSLTKSADQSINGSAWTPLTFNQESYDIGNLHNIVTNNSRITIAKDGEYEILYHVKHDLTDKITYQTRILKNGVTIMDGICDIAVGSKDAAFSTLSAISPLITLVATDYIELQFYHDNASSQDILASNTHFTIRRVY